MDDKEKKTYQFNFVVEGITREQAERIGDHYEANSPVTFAMLAIPTYMSVSNVGTETEAEVLDVLNLERIYIGMHEVEEEPDEQDEEPQGMLLSPGLFGKSTE